MSIYEPSGDAFFELMCVRVAELYWRRSWHEAVEAWFWNEP